MTRAFHPLRKKPLTVSMPRHTLRNEELVDEEICPGYDSKRFYPARPGEVLDHRYQILVKVGWGSSSTVWFARDMRGYMVFPHTYTHGLLLMGRLDTTRKRKVWWH